MSVLVSRVRCSSHVVLLLLVLTLVLRHGVGQAALQPADSLGRSIPFTYNRSFPRFPTETQALVTSYQFVACGNITQWQTLIRPASLVEYTVSFQVWRPRSTPDSTSTNTLYDLIGRNTMSFPATLRTSGRPFMLTVEPSEYISVLPGDVVGFYVLCGEIPDEILAFLEDRGIDLDAAILLDPSYDDEIVWFQTIESDDVDRLNQLDIESDGVTRSMVAPALSVDVLTYVCPTSTTEVRVAPSTTPTAAPTATPTPTPVPVNPITTTTTTAAAISVNTIPTISIGDISDGNNKLVYIASAITLVLVLLVTGTVVVVVALAIVKRRKWVSKLNREKEIQALSRNGSQSFLLQTDFNSGSLYSIAPELGSQSSSATHYEVMNESSVGQETHYATPENQYSLLSSVVMMREGFVGTGSEGHETTGREYSRIGPMNEENSTDYAHDYDYDVTPSGSQVSSASSSHECPPDTQGVYQYVPTVEQREHFSQNYESQESSSFPHDYNRLNFFEEDQIYWAPASNTSDLYAQLASKKYREIHRNQIRVLDALGAGQFGEVYNAHWSFSNNQLQIAVKILKSDAREEDKIKFLQEAAIMGQFSHPNVIKLYGVVTMCQPVMICSELLRNGDLRSYLQGMNLSEGNPSNSGGNSHVETKRLFLRFSRDIAAGMEYLAGKSFVHRDLAARNILLDDSLVCKIGDFGMARDLMDDSYYKSTGGKIPVKWTAPEALLYKKYSQASDVWSYGMVLFEIWSVGRKPFSSLSNQQVMRQLQEKRCQAPPPGCPRAVYKIMVHCWNPNHERRPSFEQLSSQHLRQSSTRMLHWSQAGNHTHAPSVAQLGAPLEEAFKLHMDLQEAYKPKSSA